MSRRPDPLTRALDFASRVREDATVLSAYTPPQLRAMVDRLHPLRERALRERDHDAWTAPFDLSASLLQELAERVRAAHPVVEDEITPESEEEFEDDTRYCTVADEC